MSGERKRKKKDAGHVPRKHFPLSERQQLALLMQMTAEENNEKECTPPPSVRKAPGSSGRKDKINKRNERGETPLHLATIRGDMPAIIDLVNHGADINVQDYAGWTPLHEACNHGYHNIAKYLLESGANVNSKGFENDYPLHDAVSSNHHDLVQLLLKHGANPLLANKHGERPLDLSENEAITELMKSEVLVSDDSEDDNAIAAAAAVDDDTGFLGLVENSWKDRNQAEKQEKKSKYSLSSASRELFKDDEVGGKKRKKDFLSSDSDDADNVPLVNRKKTSDLDVKPLHTSCDVTMPKQKSGFLSHCDVDGSALSRSMKPSWGLSRPKPLKPPTSSLMQDDLGSSEEELPLSEVAKSRKPSSDRMLSTVISQKAADVYDFSPGADDFSSDSETISLKPENRSRLESLKSPTKKLSQSKSYEARMRKNSRDADAGNRQSLFRKKSPDRKVVLIRPTHSSPTKLQTSEILFDQLFKTPSKEDQELKPFKTTEVLTKPAPPPGLPTPAPTSSSSLSSCTFSTAVSTASQSSTAPSTPSTAPSTPSTAPSTPSTQTCPFPRTPGLSKTVLTPADAKSTTKELMPALKPVRISSSGKLPGNVTSETKKKKTKAGDVDQHKVKSSARSLSLDVIEEAPPRVDKTKSDWSESRAVKKVIRSEPKEKAAKTVSEPLRSATKLKTPNSDLKKPATKTPARKEVKTEQKKVSLLSDATSGFMGDIESMSRQRHLEKQMILKRKKLMQKRSKSNPGTKIDEKKAFKHADVSVTSPPAVASSDKESLLASPSTSQKDSLDVAQDVIAPPEASDGQQESLNIPEDPSQSTVSQSDPAKPLNQPDDVAPDQVDGKENPPDSQPALDLAGPLEEVKSSTEETKDEDPAEEDQHPPVQEDETQRMLQEYVRERLSLATICFDNPKRQKLPVYIPMSRLLQTSKNPTNVYEERAFIHKLVNERRRRLSTVVPQAPQYYWEYMTFTGGYLLSGRRESQLSVPVLGPPPDLCDVMVAMFNVQEEQRVRLRVQHAIEREKLIMSCEQDIMRVHSKAARTLHNQQVPYSACAVLMDSELYNMPRPSTDNEPGKTSIRDRFNARMFISWLQEVDDKYMKMKSSLLSRQKHEAEAMYSLQRAEWALKLQELDHNQRTPTSVNEVYVPMVNISDDFDLLPA